MNKLRFLVFACLMTFAVSCGQQNNYITYKVKKGETMKSIARRLDMKTHDLMRLNPNVNKKPAQNTTIIIPDKGLSNSSNSKPDSIPKSVKVVETKRSFETHTVKPKETVYFLTKKYEISKETLIAWNPQFPGIEDNNISVGQVLKVKKIEQISTIDVPKEEIQQQYITHTVQSKETLFSLTRQYNVSKEDLMALNPNSPHLKEGSLTLGEVLNIRLLSDEESSEENNKIYFDQIQSGNLVKVAILLPFNAKKYKEMSAEDVFKGNKLMNLITEYYLGAQIAIDSIKNQGVNIQAKVYDTGKKGIETSKIISSGKLDDVDAVIGPFFVSKARLVSKKVDAPVIFPHYSKKQKTLTSSKMVKSSPDIDDYITKLTTYLKEQYNGETIFVVGDGKSSSDEQVKSIVANLQQHNDITSDKINVLKPEKNYIKKSRFTSKMKPNTSSWVILTSEGNAAVADVLNSFVTIPDKVKVQLFAVRKGHAYNKLDNNKLGRLGFIYVTDYYTDEKNKAAKIFNRKYKDKNKVLPSIYATKGFDVTYDVLARLSSGQPLKETFDEGTSTRVANKFKYKTKIFGESINKGLFIVKYNKDLSLTKLK